MPQTTTLINAYIDANLVLFLAFAIWQLARLAVQNTSRRHDFLLQLRVSEGLIVAAILSPLLAAISAKIISVFSPAASLSITDLAVAQYLDGQVKMKAEHFETLLSTRQVFVGQLAELSTPVAQAIALVLLGGAAITTLQIGKSIFDLRSLISGSYPWRRFRRLEIRLSDRTRIPFSTRGLTRRYIIIPSSMLAEPEALRITLTHELQHMRRGDTDWELALVLLKPLFFWNPAFLLWRQHIERLRELSCDQVILGRRKVTNRDYAGCLLTVCNQSLAGAQRANIVTPKVPLLEELRGRRNRLKLIERMQLISAPLDARAPSKALLSVTLAVAISALALGVSAMKRPADWSQDRLMLSTIVNLERLEIRNSGL